MHLNLPTCLNPSNISCYCSWWWWGGEHVHKLQCITYLHTFKSAQKIVFLKSTHLCISLSSVFSRSRMTLFFKDSKSIGPWDLKVSIKLHKQRGETITMDKGPKLFPDILTQKISNSLSLCTVGWRAAINLLTLSGIFSQLIRPFYFQ